MANPFAIRASAHPAIAETYSLSSDIYPELYSFFFSSKEFIRWCGAECPWQLHCFGGPGSGKTTLCALVVQHLHARSENTAVVSVFVKADVLSNEIVFLEDFLATVYHQIHAFGRVDYPSLELFEVYEDACQAGKRLAVRIELLRKALHARLSQAAPYFLILDGIDRCSAALRLLIERELQDLQLLGVRIMVSARLRAFEKPLEATCDTDENDEVLKLFLECQKCDETVLCFPCKERGEVCPICKTAEYLNESYDIVNFGIGQIPNPSMRDFVAWDLEKEHGDFGLKSPCHDKPPLSSLGALILRNQDGNTPQTLLERILDQAEGNIGIAKLRLDNVHNAQSLEDVESIGDRLPPNIVFQFDTAIRNIEAQPASQGDLGLRAIAAAAENNAGVPAANVERWLRPKLSKFPPRSVEDVLQAANGFLISANIEEENIRLYHTSFFMYVAQNYNASLLWARSQLHFDRAFRSRTNIASLMSETRSKSSPHGPSRVLSFDSSPRSDESDKDSPSILSRTSTTSYFGARRSNYG
ncbi:uncharacterized protein BDZ99DRAFT_455882 [Mytilinidion resinicola]|uniref:Nephrocystin 3-like N-terminal domain-containing protein n=1 Tax=Mytilinidion resinicola TaxID=574789 RepID=A0A6A6XZ04_9PEZI|nr:uncharacterized protein BDZ99DRAFT_455882 [Mytilinidion resinicola]KAF2801732.1 hypothetical protein BDZ99DRAFT_455882 [Mytilinidion resinicola]